MAIVVVATVVANITLVGLQAFAQHGLDMVGRVALQWLLVAILGGQAAS